MRGERAWWESHEDLDHPRHDVQGVRVRVLLGKLSDALPRGLGVRAQQEGLAAVHRRRQRGGEGRRVAGDVTEAPPPQLELFDDLKVGFWRYDK